MWDKEKEEGDKSEAKGEREIGTGGKRGEENTTKQIKKREISRKGRGGREGKMRRISRNWKY